MPRRKVCFVTTMLARGGAETQIFRLAKSLSARGHTVDVISLFPPRAYVEELQTANVEVFDLGRRLPRAGRALGVGLGRLLARRRPDVLVGFLFHANNLVRTHGRALGVPAVLTSIRSETFGDRRRETVERALASLRLDDRVVTNSTRVARAMVEQGFVDADRIETIGNAIDVRDYQTVDDRSRAEFRRVLGVPEEEFCWLAVANFRPVKDHPNLLRAFAKLRHQQSSKRPVCLRIVGAGQPDAAWHALVAALDLHGSVRVLGERSDVAGLMQASDGLVLSSRHEGLPNVVMEALAAGCPVVSTRVGGVAELVQPGCSGLLVPPRDAEALAQAMLELQSLPTSQRAAWGAHGRAHIATHYDIEAVTTRWEAVFERAMAQAARRPWVQLTGMLRRVAG